MKDKEIRALIKHLHAPFLSGSGLAGLAMSGKPSRAKVGERAAALVLGLHHGVAWHLSIPSCVQVRP